MGGDLEVIQSSNSIGGFTKKQKSLFHGFTSLKSTIMFAKSSKVCKNP